MRRHNICGVRRMRLGFFFLHHIALPNPAQSSPAPPPHANPTALTADLRLAAKLEMEASDAEFARRLEQEAKDEACAARRSPGASGSVALRVRGSSAWQSWSLE